MGSFRLVQLSDIHLTASPEDLLFGVDVHSSLLKVLDSILELSTPVDAVVVTGDLVELGEIEEYRCCLRYLETLGVPLYVLPGNHDHAVNMGSVFDKLQFSCSRSVALGDWQLLSIDSQVKGAGHGHIGPEQLSWLQHQLELTQGLPTVLALHHTPAEHCANSGCQLNDAEDLLALVARFDQVKLLLAGHTHQAEEAELGAARLFTAPSTFAQVQHSLDLSKQVQDDFFASHDLDTTRVGFNVFDLKPNGQIEYELHWVSIVN